VELRKQVARLNPDPGLQDEEKYEIQQQRQKLENEQKSLEQEKIIYEKFRMSDQQEIAALREDFERKLKHQEALQKELELAKMHAEEERDRAKFEQEQYQKQKEKHIVRTQDLENDLKRLNIQFEDSLSLESRGEKIEEMRRQVANERQFMRQQNAKLKDSLDDISRREAQLQEKIRSIEKEKAELRAKNTRLEAKQMSLKNQEKVPWQQKEQKNRASRSQSKKVPGTLQPLKHLSDSWRLLKDDWEELSEQSEDTKRASLYISEQERKMLEEKMNMIEHSKSLEEREKAFDSKIALMKKVRDLLQLVNEGL